MMRWIGLASFAAILVGCGSLPFVNMPSTGAPPILHGLEETRPYFGQLKEAGAPGEELGDVMLALCGCKCWRVMVLRDDGAVRTQFLVHFALQGEGESPTEVLVQNEDDEGILRGTVNQDTGLAEGRMLIGPYAMVFAANRSEEDADQVKTCLACHVAEEPLRPLPTGHPEYQTSPPDCLTCHSLE